jgi:TM2 domain-containing membrane protein YozV
MRMQKRRRIIVAVLLLFSILNFSRLAGNENIRPIQFISIFVIGALSALLINEFVTLFKANNSRRGNKWYPQMRNK